MKRLFLPVHTKEATRNDSTPISFSAVALSGYYFCSACQHVTERVQRGVTFVCVRCGSTRVKYHPPLSV